MSHAEPLVSVVVTSRNDDHGGTMFRRMQTFVNALVGQCQRHGLPAELVLVDWNPPADRPRLAQALRWPADTGPCQIRVVEVPAALHRRLKHAEALPLFQMIGKNVGIRRARGRFVLATNIDILLNDELVRFMAGGNLERGRLYRIDRHDVLTDVPVDAPVQEQLDYCRTHLVRLNCREGAIPVTPDGRRTVEPEDITTAELGVIFGAGWYPVERGDKGAFRWAGEYAELLLEAPAGPALALSLEVEPGPGVAYRPFQLEVRDDCGRVVARGVVGGRQTVYLALPLGPGRRGRFHLRTVAGGQPTPLEPRTLNFRAYRCGWAAKEEPSAPPPPPDLPTSPPAGALNFRVEDVYELAGEDVVSADLGLRFGGGWHAAERGNGELFRWAGGDAKIVVQTPPRPDRALSLELEPGPGVAYRPFQLEVRDDHDRVVARGMVEGRQVIHLALPLGPGPRSRFRLRAVGGGAKLPDDTRILDFRVYKCAWSRVEQGPRAPAPSGALNFRAEEVYVLLKEDVVPADLGLRFGRGWHPVESGNGELFRWAADDARIAVQAPPGPARALSLEVEPGPGVAYRPFQLEVRDDRGRVVAREAVEGRQALHLLLPLRPGKGGCFRLIALGGGSKLPDNPRTLNFRVLRCWWSKRRAMAAFLAWLAAGSRLVQWAAEALNRLDQEGGRPAGTEAPASGGEEAGSGSPGDRAPGGPTSAGPGQGEQAGSGLPAGRVAGAQPREEPGPTIPASEGISCPVHLHTWACGDFTLMAREHWFDLRAYPEFEMYSLHIDSVLCYMAHHSGVVETVLPEPMRAYHIEHSKGSGWTPEGATTLLERLAAKGVPVLEYRQLLEWATEMRRLGRHLAFDNDENWGLAAEQLPETVIGGTAH